MRIGAKIKRLQSVDLHQIVNDSAKENEKEIVEMNQDQMYKQGTLDVNKPGKKEKYAPGTVRQKKKKATLLKLPRHSPMIVQRTTTSNVDVVPQ